jgi:preprotein translocase subunit SecB
MAEDAKAPSGAQPDPQAGGEAQRARGLAMPIAVRAQYIKDLSFESPNTPQVLTQMTQAPAVTVNVDIRVQKLQETDFEVVLQMEATAKIGEDTAFLVELAYGGVFHVGEVAPEHLRPLLLIECPRLLFPFARAIIANVTRDAGMPPMMISPIDFVDLYRKQLQREAGEAKPAGNGGAEEAKPN